MLNSVPYQTDKTGTLTSVWCPHLATHISHFSRHGQTSGKHLSALAVSNPSSLLLCLIVPSPPHPYHCTVSASYKIASWLPNPGALASPYLFVVVVVVDFLPFCTFLSLLSTHVSVLHSWLPWHCVPPPPQLIALGLLQGLVFLYCSLRGDVPQGSICWLLITRPVSVHDHMAYPGIS